MKARPASTDVINVIRKEENMSIGNIFLFV